METVGLDNVFVNTITSPVKFDHDTQRTASSVGVPKNQSTHSYFVPRGFESIQNVIRHLDCFQLRLFLCNASERNSIPQRVVLTIDKKKQIATSHEDHTFPPIKPRFAYMTGRYYVEA